MRSPASACNSGSAAARPRRISTFVGLDYEQRFKTLMSSLELMKQAWRGEPVPGGQLTPWPGTEGGPDVMLGAWRNKRWIVYSAEQCAGWIASGLYSQPEELAVGMKIYRDAGGKRAILANVIIDLTGNAEGMPLGGRATVMLTGGEAAALDKLKRIKDVGFDDILCMTTPESARRPRPPARRPLTFPPSLSSPLPG